MQNPVNDSLLRVKQVLDILPVSRSGFWAGVASGRYPKPIKLSPRVTCWRKSEILALLQRKEG